MGAFVLQLPIPEYKALPHEPGCKEENLIVCANGHIQGRQGVALDDLVYIMTRQAGWPVRLWLCAVLCQCPLPLDKTIHICCTLHALLFWG